MRKVTACLAISLLMASSASAQQTSPDPAASQSEPGTELYSTSATPIAVLLADPEARAILEQHLPAVAQSDRLDLFGEATLKSIQGYSRGAITEEALAQVDSELAALGPRWSPEQGSGFVMTTDEAKVRSYSLPEALVLANGKPVTDAKTWWNERRPEILEMFQTYEYGRAPGRPEGQRFEITEADTPAFGGKAIRRQIRIHMSDDPGAPAIKLVRYIPAATSGPVPMMVVLGFVPPSAMFGDADLPEGKIWDRESKAKIPLPPSYAAANVGSVEVEKFLDAGFGVAGYYYGDVDPDFAGGYDLGIRHAIDLQDEAERAPDAWGSIGAWAWSLSRVQDYLETDPSVDSDRVAITGASRLGKTVLWAAARDQRFAAVMACCSGKKGAGILRRNFGSAAGEDTSHWMAPNWDQFEENPDALPMDSHMLLGLIAPRPVLLQTGRLDYAADPKGEFLAAVAAGPVYRLLGASDLGTTSWPPEQPILNDIGYTLSDGGHGMAPGDWDIYLAFLKKHLQPEVGGEAERTGR